VLVFPPRTCLTFFNEPAGRRAAYYIKKKRAPMGRIQAQNLLNFSTILCLFYSCSCPLPCRCSIECHLDKEKGNATLSQMQGDPIHIYVQSNTVSIQSGSTGKCESNNRRCTKAARQELATAWPASRATLRPTSNAVFLYYTSEVLVHCHEH
jgi:hypothetical protein